MFLYLTSHSHQTDAIHGWAQRLQTQTIPPNTRPGIKHTAREIEMCVWVRLLHGNVHNVQE